MNDVPSMEPMYPGGDPGIEDLVLELVGKASAFMAEGNAPLRRSLGDLVRSMNCYYSNLIEGHATQLIDIERALEGDYSEEPERRNLQLEAKAHIEVQRMIDRGEMPFPVISVEGICWIHREFCRRLPKELLAMEDPATGAAIQMVPGELRAYHVRVGRHEAPAPEALEHLLWRFVDAYTSRMMTRMGKLASIPAAHHRLAWIHPFMDGNGRVSRLLSHAMLRDLGVGSELWSVSRGLARRVGEYKALLQAADEPRRGDRDGRGTLTESGLRAFCRFFLEVCIDQIDFMKSLIRPEELLNRVEIWTKEEIKARRLPNGSWAVLREAILIGEFPRSRMTELTNHGERQARTVLARLMHDGLLVSDTPKGPVRLGFPSSVVDRWLPGLYAPQASLRPSAATSPMTGNTPAPMAQETASNVDSDPSDRRQREELGRRIVEVARSNGDEVDDAVADGLAIYGSVDELIAILEAVEKVRKSIAEVAAETGVELPSYDT